MPSRNLILGCGYLGRRVAARWLAEGANVAALTRSRERAAELKAAGIEPIVGDVLDPASLELLPESDAVLYAVGFDRTSGRSQQEVYVNGLANVLARIANRTRRLIYVSSVSVYGQSNGEWVDETSRCEPMRENGRACLDAESEIWRVFAREADADRGACILRLAGLYGPGRLLQRIETLKAGEPIAGDPDGFLNLIHVDDAATSVLACEQRGRPGETYLACDNQPVRRRDYYEQLAALVGAPSPHFEGAGARTGGLNKRCSNRKLREVLGVELQYPTFAEGLRNAISAT